jgi:heme-degrading monooxygenase HmoA
MMMPLENPPSGQETPMFAVIFEVKPRADRMDAYLAIAGALKPRLEQIVGFVSNERFESLRRPGWLLSFSLWRDEKSLIRWRTEANHHHAQIKGRSEIFADYHLRVGEVLGDGETPLGQALSEYHGDVTEVGLAKSLVLIERRLPAGKSSRTDAAALTARLGVSTVAQFAEWDVLESIVTPGKFLVLASGEVAATSFAPDAEGQRCEVRIIRDYGMFDRREAPQYYPSIAWNSGTGERE